ncbi:MAG: MarR family transcriptional regulator [Thermodesulfobacteriota bacterium]
MTECREDSLGRLIYFTAQDMTNFAEKLLKPYDLTLEQFHLLKNIDIDSGISQRQLGEAANKTPANMTRMLDRMEVKSLVVRRADPDDRRASLVSLTGKGKALIEEVFGEFNSYSDGMLLGIAEGEQHIAREVLTKMAGNVQAMTEELAGNIKG